MIRRVRAAASINCTAREAAFVVAAQCLRKTTRNKNAAAVAGKARSILPAGKNYRKLLYQFYFFFRLSCCNGNLFAIATYDCCGDTYVYSKETGCKNRRILQEQFYLRKSTFFIRFKLVIFAEFSFFPTELSFMKNVTLLQRAMKMKKNT